MARTVLVVYHSMGGNTAAAAEIVAEGIRSVAGADAVVKSAAEAGPSDLLACDGVCFGSPDYFSYMAGMLKDFFDRTFYPTQGQVDDKPCAIFITHGGGGSASTSVEKICRSFRFKQVGQTLLVRGKPDDAARTKLRDLGALLAKTVL
ncbi:MAG TPA: NAD(P)H-dependent oxidoreductase [Candidatus Latescibacteria bacterium]|nr:MAG: Flavodoxin [Candidatus Latescibacteria bacterium ADurb.Bin168]HPU83996.1 NAD(P)H-dependent oxidoreductase [Candidatus Latescibacterota bacterium]